MNTIYIHRRFQGKQFVGKKKNSRGNKRHTHMQCSSMRNTPSHVSQTKKMVCSVSKTEQK